MGGELFGAVLAGVRFGSAHVFAAQMGGHSVFLEEAARADVALEQLLAFRMRRCSLRFRA